MKFWSDVIQRVLVLFLLASRWQIEVRSIPYSAIDGHFFFTWKDNCIVLGFLNFFCHYIFMSTFCQSSSQWAYIFFAQLVIVTNIVLDSVFPFFFSCRLKQCFRSLILSFCKVLFQSCCIKTSVDNIPWLMASFIAWVMSLMCRTSCLLPQCHYSLSIEV